MKSKNADIIERIILIYFLVKLSYYCYMSIKLEHPIPINSYSVTIYFLNILIILGLFYKKRWTKYVILFLLGHLMINSTIQLTTPVHPITILIEIESILINSLILFYLFFIAGRMRSKL